VVASQDGSIVYVSAPSNASGVLTNKVFAIDTLNRTLLDTDFDTAGVQPLTVGATAGSAPQGMAVNLSTNEVYVINRGEGTISTITMTPLGGTI
jgi:DNA-binding beta-propeller fold protein YncE